MEREELLGAIARGWCTRNNEHKVMDVDLAVAIANEVEAVMPEGPLLGMATTSHLLEELAARCEMFGLMYYKPYDVRSACGATSGPMQADQKDEVDCAPQKVRIHHCDPRDRI